MPLVADKTSLKGVVTRLSHDPCFITGVTPAPLISCLQFVQLLPALLCFGVASQHCMELVTAARGGGGGEEKHCAVNMFLLQRFLFLFCRVGCMLLYSREWKSLAWGGRDGGLCND